MKILIDFEVYSEIDLTLHGAYIYAEHPSTKILCMAYKIDEWPTEIWTPELPFPLELTKIGPEDKVYAFNANFEWLIWNNVGCRDHPYNFYPIKLSSFIDVQGLCARYKFPQSLDAAAKALRCNTEKMAIGKKLIRVCCTPGYYPTQKDYQDLYTYCIIDVEAMAEILTKLPADYLTPEEQEIWELTQEMNYRGVPIDLPAVEAIIEYIAVYMDAMKTLLPEVTGGMISTPGQIQKIKGFCKSHGVELPNLQAETVEKYLKDDSLHEDVRTVLEIRQLTGMTSIKKFITLKNLYNNGVVQGNLVYHGAGTGRWTGRGFQFHNLPRAKVDNPEEWIEKFIKKEEIERPVDIGKALIRPMIKAPDGYKIIVSDYSSIENRLLAWFCDDEQTLNLFANGDCQYTDMAAFLYNKPASEIDKKSNERQMGKVIVLGCLAKGTKVLTNSGYKNIEDITLEDRLNDGTGLYVNHDGLLNKGIKECINISGLRVTKDHKILTQEGWKEAWQLKENIQLENQALCLALLKSLNLFESMVKLHIIEDSVLNAGTLEDLKSPISNSEEQNNVELVQEKQRTRILIHIQESLEYLSETLTDYLTDSLLPTIDVPIKIMRHINTMGNEVLDSIGTEISKAHLPILFYYQDGMTHILNLIEKITMGTTNREILDSQLEKCNAIIDEITVQLNIKEKVLQQQNFMKRLRQSTYQKAQCREKLKKENQQSKLSQNKITVEAQTYDILNVGKKNRFIVLTENGPIIVHNCGYQMGKARFRAVAADWGFDLTIEQAEMIVKAYRRKYPKVVKMWKSYNNAAIYAVNNPGKSFKTCKCEFKVVKDKTSRNWLRITLPSGRGIMYSSPRVEDDKYGNVVKYMGLNAKTHQMMSNALTPGVITENVVQAAARDILARGKLNIKHNMPEAKLILSVHDEAGALIRESNINDKTMDTFNSLLCEGIHWIKDMPLSAEGYIATRYKKD